MLSAGPGTGCRFEARGVGPGSGPGHRARARAMIRSQNGTLFPLFGTIFPLLGHFSDLSGHRVTCRDIPEEMGTFSLGHWVECSGHQSLVRDVRKCPNISGRFRCSWSRCWALWDRDIEKIVGTFHGRSVLGHFIWEFHEKCGTFQG